MQISRLDEAPDSLDMPCPGYYVVYIPLLISKYAVCVCVCVHVCAYIYTHTNYKWPWGFPGGSVVKNPPANILRF